MYLVSHVWRYEANVAKYEQTNKQFAYAKVVAIGISYLVVTLVS